MTEVLFVGGSAVLVGGETIDFIGPRRSGMLIA